ncbi:MAG TPA: lipopolysaccharide kinase InaA family protein [Gemmatimonadaceae bacterium]
MTATRRTPPGYVRLSTGSVEGVALATLAPALARALAEGSFYAWAEHHPEARALAGRGIAWAVPLPDGETRVVVRRSRHGGLLAPVRGDRFIGRTRAPRELDVALRLARAGVPTPELVAYATYRAGSLTRRADVVTREIAGARDLAATIEALGGDDLRPVLRAVAALLAALTAAGARHPDLNLKNILIAPDVNGEPEAFVIDVDRVWFDSPGAPRVAERNMRRLARSARKLRRTRDLPVHETDLLWLAATAGELTAASPA